MRMSGWAEIEGLHIYGRAREKGPILAFNMDAAHAHDIATVIDPRRRRRARRHALRDAAAGALWRDVELPRVFRALQHTWPRSTGSPRR